MKLKYYFTTLNLLSNGVIMTLYRYLNEAKDRLDISIQAASKWLTSDKKKEEFLSTPVDVEMKLDGVKANLLLINDTGDYTKDWIVSYKGEIQYPTEFDFASTYSIKKSSIANAQFKLVFEHLKKITPNLFGIPINTEFFIEMIMKKPTLSSNYTKHGMILIASSPCTWEDNFGKLKTRSTFDTSNREKYSKILKIPTPELIFSGVLGNQATFESSIRSKDLKEKYNEFKSSINWNDKDSIISGISQMFLALDSKYGNHKEEGVVIKYKDGSRYLKFVQPYQTDQAARAIIKSKYKEDDPEDENLYWDRVRLAALNIIQNLTHGKVIKYSQFPEFLEKAAKELKKYKLDFSHAKKNTLQIKDDIAGQIKLQSRKSLKGNNGSLILGRFQPLTKGHEKMINLAKKESDSIVICVVRARKPDPEKNPIPYDLQVKMIREVYPDAEIITHSTANLFSIMQKASHNINTIYAGTDRAAAYRNIISRNKELSVREVKRTDEDISASKVRQAIKDNDMKTFKQLMDRKLWKYWDELKKYVI